VGLQLAIDDEIAEYIDAQYQITLALVQRENLNNDAFKDYQSQRFCVNCRKRGHTMEFCPDIRRGIFRNHCRQCYTPLMSRHKFCARCMPKNDQVVLPNGQPEQPANRPPAL
jgi:hypothetical protein